MGTAFRQGLRTACRPRSLADLAADGITPAQTRSSRWRRSSRGFFVPAEARMSSTQRILDAAPLVPRTGALAGWAAAFVHGLDELDGLDPFELTPLPVPISLGADLGRVDGGGVTYRRDGLLTTDRQMRHELMVTTPLRTAYDAARWAPDLVEAVAVLDLTSRYLGVDLAELGRRCAGPRNLPGIRQVREALIFADPASANAWESRLRMFYQLVAGLPRRQVNIPIFDLDERLLGVGDLVDPDAGLVTEFDGQDHRLRHRHQADNIREERLETANLTVCRVDSLDLRQPVPLAERLRSRHAQARRRNRSEDRWTLTQPGWWRRQEAARNSRQQTAD